MSAPTSGVGAPIALHFAQRIAFLAQSFGRINLQLSWFEAPYLRVSFFACFAPSPYCRGRFSDGRFQPEADLQNPTLQFSCCGQVRPRTAKVSASLATEL